MLAVVVAIALSADGLPCDFGSAEVLIMTCPNPDERLLSPPQNNALTEQLIKFCQKRPYYDYFSEKQSYYWTTKRVARLLQELEWVDRSMPPLSDLARFPNKQYLAEAYSVSIDYSRWLALQSRFWLPEERAIARAIMDEMNRARRIYNNLETARNTNLNSITRRFYLNEVLADLGEENYAAGRLPVAVPENARWSW